jgi:hypothetical protein
MQGVGPCPNKAPLPKLSSGLRGRPPSDAFNRAVRECVDKLGIRNVLSYQPVNRYWTFQWYEAALFVGLALVLIAFSFWLVRRRLS